MNDYIYNELAKLNSFSFEELLINETHIKDVPDGAILVKKLQKDTFSYNIQINDNKMHVYHRTNGVTKYKIYNHVSNYYGPVLSIISGVLWGVDLFDKAYFRKFFPDVFIVSGLQAMPFKSNDNESEYIQRIINVTGSTFYPLAISLLMPLFMYTIVLEKEVTIAMLL